MRINDICKCDTCGSIVEVLTAGPENQKCDGQTMTRLEAKTADAATEKHVPVAESVDGGGTKVKVGSVPHPMTEEHHIAWIEIINGDYVNRKYLSPGEAPEADFYVSLQPGQVIREFCNVHGLWETRV